MNAIKRNGRYVVLGLAPALALYVLFVLVPILRSFVFGFYDWNGLSAPVFSGLSNFRRIFSDPVFWQSLKNNLLVVVASIGGQVPLGILAAVALNGKLPGARYFRTAFFVPMILSTVVVGLLWSTILNSQVGVLKGLFAAVGLASMPDWLGDPRIAIYTLCAVIVWQFVGLYMIIFLAALQNIPEELLEAAEIDGAGEAVKLFRIRLPLLRGTIAAAVVLCISGSMRSFDLIYVMTQGGPANSTEVMATYMYNKTFTVYQYGYGSAVSLVIAAISFAFIVASRALLLRRAEQEA
jgi:raffinose/stachyose/melibiose transport system permease protein